MANTVRDYLKKIKRNRQQRKRMAAVLMVLSVMVATGVAWQLRQTGISMTGDVYCGKEEHTHTEECKKTETAATETVLACTLPEHTHTDACIQKTLICGQEESQPHTHSVDNLCYATNTVLTCTQAEHTHGAECYDAEGNLICTQAEHTHGDGCYTEEQTLVCTLPETEGHTHTDACYETTYICGQEEHTHTDACYTTQTVAAEEGDFTSGDSDFSCGEEEHTHSLACYSNPEADVETEETWKATFSSVTLTGEYGEDVAAIAKTQIGYHESTENYDVKTAADGTEIAKGYTRYGAWYGKPYEDWSAMFASFCIKYAGVDYPVDSNCASWIGTLSENGKYVGKNSWTPAVGDIVFFDTNGDGTADQAGIVSELTDGGIKAIVGDSSDEVKENSCSLSDGTITGYGVLPIKEEEEAEENTETAEEPEETEAEDPNAEADVETSKDWEATSGGVTVKVKAEKDVVPEGAEINLDVIGKESTIVDEAFEETGVECDEYLASKVIFTKNGEEVAQSGNAEITFSVLQSIIGESSTNIKLFQVTSGEEETAVTEVTASESGGGTLSIGEETIEANFSTVAAGIFVYTWDDKAPELEEQTLEAIMYSGSDYEEELSEDETKITLAGKMPIGAVVKAYPAVLGEDVLSEENILAAYDISIFDEDGNKYEPDEENPISVSIESDLISENEKASDINVYHMDDAEAEPEAVDVETVENEKVTFEGEKFSIYVITGSDSATSNGVSLNIDTYIALEPGGSIEVEANDDESRNETFTYTIGDETIASVSGLVQGTNGEDTTFKITAGSGAGKTTIVLTSTYNKKGRKETNKKTIHVYVLPKATDSSSGTEGEITYNKTAEKTTKRNAKGDSIYNISLTFTGHKNNFKKKERVDVLFIVDVSNSMTPYSEKNRNGNAEGEDRIAAAKTAINAFVKAAGSDNLDLDARYALVKFSGSKDSGKYNDASVLHGWQTTPDTSGLEANGGTNYEAGLMVAADLLRNDTSGAKKLVIFLTDGVPTYYYDANGYTEGEGGSKDEGAVSAAKTALSGLSLGTGDYFYAVGCGTATQDTMESLIESMPQKCTKGYITKASADDLAKAFEDIAAGTSSVEMKTVTITDTLSNNVEFAENSSAETIKNSIKVMEGETDDTENWTISVEGKKVTATRTFADGTFDTSAEYKLVIPVVASDTAKSAYVSGDYTDTADAGTGTYASQTGFYSNAENSATVSYTDTDEKSETLQYAEPVVRVYALTVTKTLPNNSEIINALDGKLKFEITGTETYTGVTTGVTFDKDTFTKTTNEENGTVTYTKTISVPENTYTLTESGAEIEGYTLTATKSDTQGETTDGVVIVNDKNTKPTVSFVNSYEKKTAYADLELTKVDSLNNNITLAGAEFTLTKTRNKTAYYYTGATSGVATWASANEDGSLPAGATRAVDSSGELTLTGLVAGTYTLTETKAPDGYNLLIYTITVRVVEDGTVTLTKSSDGTGSGGSIGVTPTSLTNGRYGKSNSFFVQNDKGAALPNTGGSGTTMYTLSGLLLMMSAALVYGCRLRRRREGRAE